MTARAVGGDFAAAVPPLPAPYRLHAFQTLDSTNEEARRRAQAGEADGCVIWAETQGAGRGRRGRVWASPPGNLYATILLRPSCTPAQGAELSFVTALAIHEVVAKAMPDGKPVWLKWPNDVLVGGRKIAGVLLESHLSGQDALDWLIIGCGLNLISFPGDVERPATSLLAEDVVPPSAPEALAELVAAFDRWFRFWRREGFSSIRAAWLERAHGLGGPIQVRLGSEEFSGVFRDLDETGALIVDTPEGPRVVAAGDVFLPTASGEV
jgi:BirA family biotin operon repressor/biotin-[acetyl-CoA-carboxylase] ligase